MTNEELVTRYREGDRSAITELWEQVGGWCFRVASKYRIVAEDNRAVDMEDLMQAAFLGVLEAVKAFDPERGGFITILTMHVKNACRTTLGLRGRERKEHYDSISAEMPLGEGFTLADTLEDESLPDPTEAIEHEELRQEMQQAVGALPEQQQDVIQLHYYEGMPWATIDQRIPGAKRVREKAMHTLRRDPALRFYYSGAYWHKGLSAFNTTWSSVVEDAVIRMG